MAWKKNLKFHRLIVIAVLVMVMINALAYEHEYFISNKDTVFTVEGDGYYVDSTGNVISSLENLQDSVLHDGSSYETVLETEEIQDAEPVVILRKEFWNEDARKKATEGINYEGKKKEEEQVPIEFDPINQKEKSWLAKFFETRAAQLIVLIVVISVLIYFISRFLSDLSVSKDKKLAARNFSLEHLEENLEESDMDEFLRIALKNGDYRTAVRVFYLTIIKDLHKQNHIKWQKEKTNFDYVRELRGNEHYNSFRNVTSAYELVWYGNAVVTSNEYQLLEPVFRKFINQITSGIRK